MQPSRHPPVVCSFATKDILTKSLAEFIVKAQKESIDKKGRFTVALSGGSLPNMLGGLIENDLVKWDFWYCKHLRQPKSQATNVLN